MNAFASQLLLEEEEEELRLTAVVVSRVLKARQLNKPAWFLIIEYRYCMVINLVDVAGCL